MRRTLTVKREILTELDKGDLAQIVAASVSCPIRELRDKVLAITAAVAAPPNVDTNVPTFCHCP